MLELSQNVRFAPAPSSFYPPGSPFSYENFGAFLASAFTLVIGIEFVRMLIKHTPSSVVEVLLFAIARQLVVTQVGTFETLLGIVATGVYAVRKFLFILSSDGLSAGRILKMMDQSTEYAISSQNNQKHAEIWRYC